MSAIRDRLAAVLCCALGSVASCDPPPDLCTIDTDCKVEDGEVCDTAEGECQVPCSADSDCDGLWCCREGLVSSCSECDVGVGGQGGGGALCDPGEQVSAIDGLCHAVCATPGDCYAEAGFCADDVLCYPVRNLAGCDQVSSLPVLVLGGPLLFDPGQDAIGTDGAFCTKAASCANNGNVCQFSFQFYDPDNDVAFTRADLYSQLKFVEADGTLAAPYEVLEPAGNLLFLQGCFDEADSSIALGVVLFDAARHQSNPLCLTGSAP